MRITSRRRGNCTSVDLRAGHWRLGVAAVPTTAGGGLGLVLRWPSDVSMMMAVSPGQTMMATDSYAFWALAVAEVSLAKGPEAIEPIALIALEDDTQEKNVARVTEAMSLFRNMPRYREEALVQDIASVVALVAAYWTLTSWVMAGGTERLDLTVGDAQLVAVT